MVVAFEVPVVTSVVLVVVVAAALVAAVVEDAVDAVDMVDGDDVAVTDMAAVAIDGPVVDAAMNVGEDVFSAVVVAVLEDTVGAAAVDIGDDVVLANVLVVTIDGTVVDESTNDDGDEWVSALVNAAIVVGATEVVVSVTVAVVTGAVIDAAVIGEEVVAEDTSEVSVDGRIADVCTDVGDNVVGGDMFVDVIDGANVEAAIVPGKDVYSAAVVAAIVADTFDASAILVANDVGLAGEYIVSVDTAIVDATTDVGEDVVFVGNETEVPVNAFAVDAAIDVTDDVIPVVVSAAIVIGSPEVAAPFVVAVLNGSFVDAASNVGNDCVSEGMVEVGVVNSANDVDDDVVAVDASAVNVGDNAPVANLVAVANDDGVDDAAIDVGEDIASVVGEASAFEDVADTSDVVGNKLVVADVVAAADDDGISDVCIDVGKNVVIKDVLAVAIAGIEVEVDAGMVAFVVVDMAEVAAVVFSASDDGMKVAAGVVIGENVVSVPVIPAFTDWTYVVAAVVACTVVIVAVVF